MVMSRMPETGLDAKSKQGRISMFLRWWGRELLMMLPPRLALLLGMTHKIISLIPEGDDFTVQLAAGDKGRILGRLSVADVRDQVARHRTGGVECVLRMPASQGLRRQAPIAVSALPRGFEAIAGEIERQTPFAPDQVYAGYRVEDTVDARGRVMAHLALIPCANADSVLKTLSHIGVTPDRISLADDAGSNPIGDTVHILRNVPGKPPPTILLACVCSLLLIALISPLWRNASVLSGYQHKLVALRAAAQSIAVLDNGSGDPHAQMVWLAAQRNQRPPVVSLLNAISTALPDTAHLAQFELSGTTLSMQGVAASASDLIAPLEALAMVEKVEFSAPTLRDPVAGLEQFQLSVQLRGKSAQDPTP